MRFDFSQIQDVESFVSVPPGTYRCRVADVREGTSRDGSVRWSFRLEVADGEFAGRTGAWDSVTWSERGVHRVQHALAAMGFDTLHFTEPGSLTARRGRRDASPSKQPPTVRTLHPGSD